MKIKLDMQLEAVHGALQRSISTLEHRGFRIVALKVDLAASQKSYCLNVEVEGERDPSLLCRQLSRLHDVEKVAVREEAVVG